MMRLVASCGLVVGLGLVGYAVKLSVTGPPAADPAAVTAAAALVVVEGADVGDAAVGAVVPARLVIRNDSAAPIRFVGGPFGCLPGGCLRSTGPCPLTIPPGGAADIPLDVSAAAPGPFRLAAPVFLDVAGAAVERTAYVTGHGVPADDLGATPLRP